MNFEILGSRICLTFLLAMASLICEVHADEPIIYKEPGTFRKVAPYEVQLKVDGAVTTFAIPKSCGELIKQRNNVETVDSGMLEIRSLLETESICSRYLLMTHGSPKPTWDFVSGIDYLNMPLSNIPYAFSCLGVMDGEGVEMCNAATEHQAVQFTDYFGNKPGTVSYTKACRLKNGYFAMSESATYDPPRQPGGEFACVPAKDNEIGNGFLLSSVSFADVNHDNYMDAIVSVVQIGPQSGTGSDTFILTRFNSDDWFKILDMP